MGMDGRHGRVQRSFEFPAYSNATFSGSVQGLPVRFVSRSIAAPRLTRRRCRVTRAVRVGLCTAKEKRKRNKQTGLRSLLTSYAARTAQYISGKQGLD